MALLSHDKITLKTKIIFTEKTSKKSQQWITDTGASHHITNDMMGLRNIRTATKEEQVEVGDGTTIKITKIGEFHGTYEDEHGFEHEIVIQDVGLIPSFNIKLLILTNVIDKGFKIGNDGRNITIKKTDMELNFNEIIETEKCFF